LTENGFLVYEIVFIRVSVYHCLLLIM